MKKIALYLTICLFFLGCEQFLTTKPTDVYTEETFWKTQKQAKAALAGVYEALNSMYDGGGLLVTENITPNAFGYSNAAGTNSIARGLHDAKVNLAARIWDDAYRGIGRANMLLAHLDEIDMAESLKSRIKGEALFLRALFYHELVNYFGGVPLITEQPSIEKQADLPRSSRKEVVAQILKDLNTASKVLPLEYGPKTEGHATKGAALALKTRVLLYNKKWAEAATAAKAVMELNQYSLFPDYRALFLPQNEGNEEVIFAVQFKAPRLASNYDTILDLYGTVAPLDNLIHSYHTINGKSGDENPIDDSNHNFKNKDPRLLATIAYPGSMWKGKTVEVDDTPWTGYTFKKYTVYKDSIPHPEVQRQRSIIDYIYLRYSDVLLMYAEARNEASGPDASVYAALNKIRDRVGMPHVEKGLTKAEMREVIRHERRIELAGEGLYYNDIRRWKIAKEAMNGPIYNYQHQKIGERHIKTPRFLLLPIPLDEMHKNPKLKQNPGYGGVE